MGLGLWTPPLDSGVLLLDFYTPKNTFKLSNNSVPEFLYF